MDILPIVMSRIILTSCRRVLRYDVENPPHEEGKMDENAAHVGLFNAAINGDWNTAESILRRNPECATHRITARGETVLHIAAAGKNKRFLRELVERIHKEELEKVNVINQNAFYIAVLTGVVDSAKVMFEKNNCLSTILCRDWNPIHAAAWNGHKKMVNYLFGIIPFNSLREKDRIDLLEATIHTNMYDVASNILDKDPSPATKRLGRNRTLLHALAQKPLQLPLQEEIDFRKQLYVHVVATKPLMPLALKAILMADRRLAYHLLKKIWNEYLKLPEDKLLEIIKDTGILHYAAKEGNAYFLLILLKSKPDLLWVLNNDDHNIFHVAVIHRQKQVLDLIYRYGPYKDFISVLQDKEKNNILHLAAKLNRTTSHRSKESNTGIARINPLQPSGDDDGKCPQDKNDLKTSGTEERDMPKSLLKIPGAALKLQRELLWFTEVGYAVPPSQHNIQNKDKKTPKQIFSEEHQELLIEGEKWMKATAKNCMLAATLITTVVFAAAFTVPGGNNNDSGIPILIKRSSFTAFMISDAVAMICSALSIIFFLSILISNYRQNDFFVLLPLKLLVGLTTLFVSIVAMLVTFAVAFSLILDKPWQPKHIIAAIVTPFAYVLILNFELWFDTIYSLVLVFANGSELEVGPYMKILDGPL